MARRYMDAPDDQKIEAYRLWTSGGLTLSQLAERMGVSKGGARTLAAHGQRLVRAQEMEAKKAKVRSLEPGFWVALTIEMYAAPLRCYVGQVQVVDDEGVRITTVDWIIGMATGYDVFVPWAKIESALVATPEHDLSMFRDDAARWQMTMSGKSDEEINAILHPR